MAFNPSQPRAANGMWGAGGAAGAKPAGKGKPPVVKGKKGAKPNTRDLFHVAKAHGMTEAELVALNPGLKALVGSGRAIPAGTRIATSKAQTKAAAKSQAAHKGMVKAQAAKGQTKAAGHAAQAKAAKRAGRTQMKPGATARPAPGRPAPAPAKARPAPSTRAKPTRIVGR